MQVNSGKNPFFAPFLARILLKRTEYVLLVGAVRIVPPYRVTGRDHSDSCAGFSFGPRRGDNT